MNPGAHEGLAVPVSYKTPAVLLIFKYGSSIVSDRGKKKIYVKGKYTYTI